MLSEDKGNQVDIKSMLDKGLGQLLKFNEVYEKGGIEERCRVISAMFPEKLHFENSSLRTGSLARFSPQKAPASARASDPFVGMGRLTLLIRWGR